MTIKNIITLPKNSSTKKYALRLLCLALTALLFCIAPAVRAEAQAISQYFEQKSENFIFHNPVFFERDSKPAFVSAETGALKAFVSGSESPLWRFGLRNELKPKKLSTSLDRSKFMLQYENNAFEIIGADGAAIYSDLTPAQKMLSAPSPEGFIFIKNNVLCSVEGPKCEKNETPLAYPAFAVSSVVTDGGSFYYSVLAASGFEIFLGTSVRSSPVCSMRSQVSAGSEALLYFSGGGDQPLKYAIGENNTVKIYDCSKAAPEFKTEFKTDSAVSSLYGANGLEGTASAVIAGCENAYYGFSDADSSKLFKLETRAKNSYLAAALHSNGINPLFFYYKSNDAAALYDIKSQKQLSEYKFDNKTLAGPVSGRYIASKNSAFFLVAYTSSILCLQVPAPGAQGDFYFSSDQRFASPAKAAGGTISIKTPDIIKNIDINKLLQLYASYKNETHIAAGALLLIVLIFAFRKKLRRAKNGGGYHEAVSGAQIDRLREMLAANPENVELTLNIIQLLKKDDKL
ncbi:MAG TPA: hypothetical protein PK467_16330, partial [Candidatus Wallbacteria bacterium]|nr:hypothetical protein [Candidatus Wallbacteria bacterium]